MSAPRKSADALLVGLVLAKKDKQEAREVRNKVLETFKDCQAVTASAAQSGCTCKMLQDTGGSIAWCDPCNQTVRPVCEAYTTASRRASAALRACVVRGEKLIEADPLGGIQKGRTSR